MNDSRYALPSDEKDISLLLDHIPIFAGIGFHERHLVAHKCRIETVAAEQIVIEQDALSNDLYAIVSGKVLVSKRKETGWVNVNTLNAGDYFGEIALLRNVRRTARVTTVTPCVFLSISRADFLSIYPLFPSQSCNNIQIVIAKRLAELSALR